MGARMAVSILMYDIYPHPQRADFTLEGVLHGYHVYYRANGQNVSGHFLAEYFFRFDMIFVFYRAP